MLRFSILVLIFAAVCCSRSFATSGADVIPTPEERIADLEARVQHPELQVAILQGKVVLKDGQYQVRPGDTGAKIALMFGITLVDLVTLNPGQAWAKLKVGQFVRVTPKAEPNQQSPELNLSSGTPPAGR